MIHLRKSSLNILNWSNTSRTKILRRIRILALKKVDRIPFMAEKKRVGGEISAAPIPTLYLNHVDILYIRASRKMIKEIYKEILRNITYIPLLDCKRGILKYL